MPGRKQAEQDPEQARARRWEALAAHQRAVRALLEARARRRGALEQRERDRLAALERQECGRRAGRLAALARDISDQVVVEFSHVLGVHRTLVDEQMRDCTVALDCIGYRLAAAETMIKDLAIAADPATANLMIDS